MVGAPVLCNGEPLQALGPAELSDSVIGVGTFNLKSRGRYPGRYRSAVLGNLSSTSSRVRMHGSTGIDFAYVAAGILGGAVSFGHHVWDHAAGVALVRAAGGVVTDLAGEPWSISSPSALVAAPGVHEQLLEVITATGVPEDYQ